MADYYGVLARAISTPDPNTPDTRTSIYDRARLEFTAHVDRQDSPFTPLDAARQRVALEQAIRRIENEIVARAIAAKATRPGRSTTSPVDCDPHSLGLVLANLSGGRLHVHVALLDRAHPMMRHRRTGQGRAILAPPQRSAANIRFARCNGQA